MTNRIANGNGQRPTNGKPGHGKPKAGDAPERRPLSELTDRQPPFDAKAELGVIGSMILMQSVCDEVSKILRPEDFYDSAHEIMYRHLLAMHETGKAYDDTLIVNRLKKSGEWEAVGGAAYLTQIVNAVPNAAHATYYAEIVRDKAIYRKVILRSTELLRDAYDEFSEPQKLLADADAAFSGVSDHFLTAQEPRAINAVALEAMAALDERMGGQIQGTPTGIAALDHVKRLKSGELIILAARPAMGKTALACNIAVHAVKHSHYPVVFFSLEMHPVELMDRILCAEARVDYGRMLRGHLSTELKQELTEASMSLSHLPLYIDDAAGKTVTQIAAHSRQLKRKHGGLALVIVDYLQLVEPDDQKVSRQEQVAKISRRLKLMARTLGVPVLALAQVNRQAEQNKDCRPRLSHLRESGSIEADADMVLFCHRPAYYDKTIPEGQQAEKAELLLAKGRNVPMAQIDMHWFGHWQRWDNPAPAHAEAGGQPWTPNSYHDAGVDF
jgi:replicative DNA helicase